MRTFAANHLEAWWSHIRAQPDYVANVVVPMAITFSIYYGFGLLFLALDHSELSWWHRRKCQPKARPIPWVNVRKITLFVTAQFFSVYPLTLWLGAPLVRARLDFSAELPDLYTVLSSFAAFALCTEAYFYHCHFLLHHPSIYSLVHKVHHEYTAPIALECLYFHPIESVLQLGTVAAGPLLLRSHVVLLYAWTVIALFNVSLHHCGHEVPLDEAPRLGSMAHQHDYHHKACRANYGVIGLFDWLYGTRGGYDEWHEKWERERMVAASAADGGKAQAEEKKAAGSGSPLSVATAWDGLERERSGRRR